METTYSDDAFGGALMAFHKGEATHYVVERDDNHVDCSSLAVYFDITSQKFGPDQTVLAQLVLGMHVLDIGCGAGRHALALQERGIRVTAIDKSPLGITACKERGVNDARVIAIEDMARELVTERFDRVIMLGHNFGLFGSFSKAQKLLGDLAGITGPNAKIIATSRNPTTTNPLHVQYQQMNVTRGRMPCQIRLRVRFRNLVGPWLDYLFVTETELQQILAGTAWHLESTSYAHDGDGSSYVMTLAKK